MFWLPWPASGPPLTPSLLTLTQPQASPGPPYLFGEVGEVRSSLRLCHGECQEVVGKHRG